MKHVAMDQFSDASWPGRPPLPPEDIFGNTKKLRFILRTIEGHRARLGRDVSILDFGCGNAAAVGQYLIGDGVIYTGVDFHEPSLSYARQHFGGLRAEFVTEVPAGHQFDVVVYADVLEHVPDPLGIVTAHLKSLAPDGIMIGSVPNGYGPCETEKFIDRHLRLYQVVRFFKRAALRLMGRPPKADAGIPYNHDSGHIIFFTMGSLKRMVADAGLRIVRFAHGGFVGADLTGNTIFASRRFVAWNIRAADRLPSWVVSTWYFVLQRP
ncbi:methyltransferase domain-containing protein [Undibacter mobilis]|nr:methyltransferase domain-containing protein [Undibacter mobilis]